MLTALKRPSSLFSSIFSIIRSSYAIFFPPRTGRGTRARSARCTDPLTLSTVIQNSVTHRMDCAGLSGRWWQRRRWWSLSFSGRQPRQALVVGAPRTIVAGSTTRLKLLGGSITVRASQIGTGLSSRIGLSRFLLRKRPLIRGSSSSRTTDYLSLSIAGHPTRKDKRVSRNRHQRRAARFAIWRVAIIAHVNKPGGAKRFVCPKFYELVSLG